MVNFICQLDQAMVPTVQSNNCLVISEKVHCRDDEFLFLNTLIDYATKVVPFPPFTPSCPPSSSQIPLLQFMSMGHTYQFFGFYISYTIVTLPLTIFYLPFMLLILCTFPPLSPSHSSVDNPPCDLHFCGSVPVLLVCLVCFCFCFRCGC